MRMKKNLFLLCAFLVPALISAQISSKGCMETGF